MVRGGAAQLGPGRMPESRRLGGGARAGQWRREEVPPMTTPRVSKAQIEAAADKPRALAVNVSGIPAELWERDQWVAWRSTRRDGKWTKVPVNPATGKNASSTDRETWGTFAAALDRYRADK